MDTDHNLHSRSITESPAEVTAAFAQSLSETVDVPAAAQDSPTLTRRSGHTAAAIIAPDSTTRERYSLTHLHGKGGMGEVWLARDSDLGRDVALKELRAECAQDADAQARFLEEAKITGQLEHPGIIPIYELVRPTDGRQPFYTMRFIRGRTLSDAIDAFHEKRRANRASPMDLRQLLSIFTGVCQAVAYAHSRGVIHRDLKGQNVVLGDFGEVMVLDWGLAKLVSSNGQREGAEQSTGLPPVTLEGDSARELTVQGQVVGTPAYMPPEQAAGHMDQIDAQSDVYSLGAILYVILTGQPPFTGSTTLEVLRNVLNKPAVQPRLRVVTTPPALEAICLKALAKEPIDRYASASELARDVERFLADEPVSAYPEPWHSRLFRWCRRHKALVSSSAALLITAVLALSTGLLAVSREKRRTDEQRRKAEAINGFLINDLLAEASPERNAWNKKVTVEEVLNRAAQKIEVALREQPEVQASINLTLGNTYKSLGLYDKATPHIQKAVQIRRERLGDEHSDTLEALDGLASLLWAQGKLPEAEPLFRRNYEALHRALGPEHRSTLAEQNNLAAVLHDQGNFVEAAELLRQNVDARGRIFGPKHPSTLAAVNNLALALYGQDKLTDAEQLLQENVKDCVRYLRLEHPETLTALTNLAVVLKDSGKPADAEPFLQKSLEIRRKVLPPDHPDLARTLALLGALLTDSARAKQAEPLLRESVVIFHKALPARHWHIAAAEGDLGGCLTALSRFAEAEPLLLGSYQTLKTSTGVPVKRRAQMLNRLVTLYKAWGKPQETARWQNQQELAQPVAPNLK